MNTVKVKKMAEKRNVKGLIKALWDSSPTVRSEATIALGNIKDPRAAEPLIKVLTEDYLWTVRSEAAIALGELKDPRSVEPLIKALWDSYSKVRGAAARALGEVKDPRAAEPLIKALTDDSWWEIRGEAVRALGEIQDPQAVEALIKVLLDSSCVREAATALGKQRDPRAIEPLITALCKPVRFDGICLYDYSFERVDIAKALKELGEQKWEKCIKGYESDYDCLLELNDARVNTEAVKASLASYREYHRTSGEAGGVGGSTFDF